MTSDLQKHENSLARRVNELRAELRLRDTAVLAHNTGAKFANDRFELNVWATAVVIPTPDFVALDAHSGQACDGLTQALLAYYFHTSDGAPLSGAWIAFSALPDGKFYTAAFQGYTGRRLAQAVGNDAQAFARAAAHLDGQRETLGDVAFRFQILPRVAMAVVCWLGDEDFGPSYRLLFDESIEHHLPTDASAILGSTLTAKLIAAREQGGASQKTKDLAAYENRY